MSFSECFVVLIPNYWGKGWNFQEALRNCLKSGTPEGPTEINILKIAFAEPVPALDVVEISGVDGGVSYPATAKTTKWEKVKVPQPVIDAQFAMSNAMEEWEYADDGTTPAFFE